MENRDRDNLSRNPGVDKDRDEESSSELGQDIGRPEKLNEPNQRQGGGSEGLRGNTGRSGSAGNMGGSESDISERDRESEIDRDQSGSEGRH